MVRGLRDPVCGRTPESLWVATVPETAAPAGGDGTVRAVHDAPDFSTAAHAAEDPEHLPDDLDGTTRKSQARRAAWDVALGELFAYAFFGGVVLTAVAILAGVRHLYSMSALAGGITGGALAALMLYGALWTARSRPGAYLESLGKTDDAGVPRSARLGSGKARQMRLVAMGFFQFALVAAFGFGMFLLL